MHGVPNAVRRVALVYLGLQFTDVSRLPVSLRQVVTLRLICTSYSPLGIEFTGDEQPILHEHEVDRMEAELLPLSAAVQQLKFEIAETARPGWCGGVWDPIVQRPRQIHCPSQSSRMYEKLSRRSAKLARCGRTLHRCEALDEGYPA